MLKILRKKGVSKKILWFVTVVIIISFGLFGSLYLFNNQKTVTVAGKIFGKTVLFSEFDKTYRDVRIQALIRHGDKFNDYISLHDIDAETWDRIILLYEANRRRLKVSDEELINTVQQYPFFQRDGQFDNLLYEDVSRYIFKVQPRDFEEAIRDSLKINKLYAQETFSVTVLEEEIRNSFKQQNEKVQVSYVVISPDNFKDAARFNEDDAKKYYEEHQYDFGVPPSINVEYIHLPYPPTLDEASEADAAKKKEIQDLAKTVAEELKENQDLKAVADAHKLEVKTSGFFSMENPKLDLGMSYELLNRLFELPVNTISAPIETLSGLFIVRVTERKEAYIPEYEEAKDKVKDAILTDMAMVVAQEKAQEMLPKLKAEYEKILPPDFANAAKALGLELAQTPVFNRGQYLPQIGISKDFQEAAFALTQDNKISDVVQAAKGFYILHLDEYVPADPKDYELQKDAIAQFLLSQKRNDVFGQFLSTLRISANLKDNVAPLRAQQRPQN